MGDYIKRIPHGKEKKEYTSNFFFSFSPTNRKKKKKKKKEIRRKFYKDFHFSLMASPALIGLPPPALVKSAPAGALISRYTRCIPPTLRINIQFQIVDGSGVRIGERGVRVTDLDEILAVRRRSNRGVHESRGRIGMVQFRKRTVRRLDLNLWSVLLHTKNLVEALPVLRRRRRRRELSDVVGGGSDGHRAIAEFRERKWGFKREGRGSKHWSVEREIERGGERDFLCRRRVVNECWDSWMKEKMGGGFICKSEGGE